MCDFLFALTWASLQKQWVNLLALRHSTWRHSA